MVCFDSGESADAMVGLSAANHGNDSGSIGLCLSRRPTAFNSLTVAFVDYAYNTVVPYGH